MTLFIIIRDPYTAAFVFGSDILYLIDYSISVLYSPVQIVTDFFADRVQRQFALCAPAMNDYQYGKADQLGNGGGKTCNA